jgi:proliferating cell nuclear antigen
MHLKTIQASAFKSIFEVLKDVLNDANIVFDANGMKILTLDTARTALIDLTLSSENFEEYTCEYETVVGVNMANLFKLLKIIGNSDTLELTVTRRDSMTLKVVNSEKNTSTVFDLKLLDINDDRIELPNVPIESVTTLASVDFQRLCRDMGNISSEINIFRKDSVLLMSCEGEFAKQSTEIECVEVVDIPVRGLYSLKYLNIFTKATTMSSKMQLRLNSTTNFLVLHYNVANLGHMEFYLAPKLEDI